MEGPDGVLRRVQAKSPGRHLSGSAAKAALALTLDRWVALAVGISGASTVPAGRAGLPGRAASLLTAP